MPGRTCPDRKARGASGPGFGTAGLLADRAAVWAECVGDDGGRPELRDRIGRYQRIGWADLDRVAGFLAEQGAADGEVLAVSDSALPLWERTGLRPPTR